MSDVTILLCSAGRRGALVQAMREGGEAAGSAVRIVVADRSPLSAAGFLADEFHLVPSVTDPTYVDALVALIDRYSIDVIVPTIDPELAVLAASYERLTEAGATVMVCDPATIDICADKGRSSQWLTDNGFAVPFQHDPSTVTDLPADQWPLFFKPRQGSSSVGAHPVASPAELGLAVERYGPGVVEALIVGEEYTMDCWVGPDGSCAAVVPRLRLAVRAGEIAKGTTVRHERLESEVARIVAALPGARGPITVQAMVGADGPAYIEINPRFGGGYPLSHAAGARYTAALVAEVSGKPVDPEWFAWQDDLVMLRYDDAVFVPRSAVDTVDTVDTVGTVDR